MPQNPQPINGLKQAAPGDVDSLIREREEINKLMARGAPPEPQAAPAQPLPQSYGGFSFHQGTPDIEGLVKALQNSGMTNSNTHDVELRSDINELLKRAAAIPVGQ